MQRSECYLPVQIISSNVPPARASSVGRSMPGRWRGRLSQWPWRLPVLRHWLPRSSWILMCKPEGKHAYHALVNLAIQMGLETPCIEILTPWVKWDTPVQTWYRQTLWRNPYTSRAKYSSNQSSKLLLPVPNDASFVCLCLDM